MKSQKTLLRHLRRSRELSLDLLAHETGINVSTLSRGERRLIDFTDEQLASLAAYFAVAQESLLTAPPNEAVA